MVLNPLLITPWLTSIIGVDHNNKSFFIAFAFLPDESEGLYSWALAKIKALYSLIHPTIGLIPGTISTDCDQALRNAIATIFPESGTLLCHTGTGIDIQAYLSHFLSLCVLSLT